MSELGSDLQECDVDLTRARTKTQKHFKYCKDKRNVMEEISGFHCGAVEPFVLLGCYTV